MAPRASTARLLAVVLLLVSALAALAPAPTASAAPNARIDLSVYRLPGPHPVATSQPIRPCWSTPDGLFFRTTVTLGGLRSEPTCTPDGVGGGTTTWYPSDAARWGRFPVVLFTPGLGSNSGMYDALLRQWASWGFVVVSSSDTRNFSESLQKTAMAEARRLDTDASSPLRGHLDLTHVVTAGHSAGATAAALAAGDTGFSRAGEKVVGTLALHGTVLARYEALRQPILQVAGTADPMTRSATILGAYRRTTSAPAWYAEVRGADHLAPLGTSGQGVEIGLTTAWLRHLTSVPGLADGREQFRGSGWLLPGDRSFARVERNAEAARLR